MKYRLLIIWLSLKWVFKINIGDKVKYNGKIYVVSNGVRHNCWRLDGLDNGDSGWVKRSSCKKVKSLVNFIGSFKSGYNFYMTSWFNIWQREGIQDWMRSLKIWGNH